MQDKFISVVDIKPMVNDEKSLSKKTNKTRSNSKSFLKMKISANKKPNSFHNNTDKF